jgi:alkylhydroperoxidase family enzyme
MQLIHPVDPHTAEGRTAELFKGVEQRLGRVPNMLRLMGNSPSILAAYLAFTDAFQHARMSPRLRGLLTAAIAELNRCDYIVSLAYVLGPREGLSADELTAGRRLESPDPKIAAALRFAASVVDGKGHIAGSEVQKLQAAGYDDEEIVEIIGFIALSLFRNYFNLVVGTDLDFPRLESGEGAESGTTGQARASG